jgi:PAP2 superfamily protein
MSKVARIARPVMAEALIVVLFGLTYVVVREATEGSTVVAMRNAKHLQHLEHLGGVAWERAVQSAILGTHALVELANWIYIWGHWPVIAAVAISLFSVRRDRYRLLRNALMISGLIGFFFFALFPTAPPRLADAGLVDTVTQWSDSYRTLQPPTLTNQYAAMPSLHFGWNLLVGIVLFGTTRSVLVRGFAVVMPAAMAFAVIATANHWVLDVAAGAVVVLVGFLVARLAERRAVASVGVAQTVAHPLVLYWERSERQDRVAPERSVPRRASRGKRRPSSSPGRGAGRRAGRSRRPAVPRSR